MNLLYGIKRFRRLTRAERLLFIEAFFEQLWAGFVIKTVPFRYIPKLFAERVQGSRFKVQGEIDNEREVIREVKRAVERAGIVSPWRNRCLVESLAARCMLNRRRIPSQISLGVARGEKKKLTAHAWIRSGDTEIVPVRGDYRELYLF